MGKTMLIDKFVRAHRPRYDRQLGVEKTEIIALQMPTAPGERRFYVKLLETIGAPCRPGERVADLEYKALQLLRRMGPKVIVVDEVHHLLAGSGREQRVAMNLLKYLSNELQCCMVAVGTRDALTAMQTDAQIASRFRPLELPRWSESEELRRFLMAFERMLPLREPSHLAGREMTQTLLEASEGITGNIAALLTLAARKAIRSGKERIDLDLLRSLIEFRPEPA
jgi:Cdc6-like AAA superfamily ATPase